MDLSVRDEVFGGENRAWLGSQHGTQSNRSITIDASLFTAGTHYPDGVIPSGILVAEVGTSGIFGPYDAAATDGRETPAGHLFNSIKVATGAKNIGAPLFWHGAVVESKLPGAAGVDAAAKTALAGKITYF